MPSELLLVGRVARAHGNKGQVIVNPETDFPGERFAAGNTLVVEQAGKDAIERRIVSVRFQQGRPIVAFDGVETMNEAEALAGAELKMPAEAIPPLPAQTYYRHDLVGCDVQDPSGRSLGRVVRVEGSLERSHLVVEGARGEILIPLVDQFCERIDPAGRVIVIRPPDGLVELNETKGFGNREIG
jgi:16S rRNA processing protein RimM